MVCGVADSQASQGCGEVPLGRTIIQTETPTATWKHRRDFSHIYVIYVQFDDGKRSGIELSAATLHKHESLEASEELGSSWTFFILK